MGGCGGGVIGFAGVRRYWVTLAHIVRRADTLLYSIVFSVLYYSTTGTAMIRTVVLFLYQTSNTMKHGTENKTISKRGINQSLKPFFFNNGNRIIWKQNHTVCKMQ